MLHKLRSIQFSKTILALILILVLASVLRLWNLSNDPPGFNADEASLGYNAYSILKTGRDEYGTFLPLVFKSFNDYKPGLYVYLALPFVATLGLTELAVRLPSVLFGIGTVLLIYFLAKKVFDSNKIGLAAAFLLAICPWHIHFSRGAWETNVATFLTTLGVYLFLKAINQKKYLFWSMLVFLLAMYTYQASKLNVPILALLLLIIYRKNFLPHYLYFIKYLVILLILSIPFLLQFTGSGGGTSRFNGLSIFADGGPASRVNQLRGEHQNPGGLEAVLIHNKITAYGPSWLSHYIDHFNPDFLFINGDPLIRNKVPETGQFYLIESLFLVVGLLGLVSFKSKYKVAIIIWLLSAPLASSLTYQTPSALRSLAMVIPLTIFMAYGVWILAKWAKKYNLTVILAILLLIAISFETAHYLDEYYIHYPKAYPLSWEYGFKQMVPKLEEYQSGYNNIVITDRYDQAYILVLFFEKYPPSLYQPQAHLTPPDKFNYSTIRQFDKYQFHSITADEINKNPNTLFIGTGTEIPVDANIIDKINFPDGSPAFVFATARKPIQNGGAK